VAIDAAEVRRIARLACLELDEAAIETYRHQLGAVLDHVRRLERLENVAAPLSDPSGEAAPAGRTRQDVPRPGLGPDEATRGAPEARDGTFLVPPIAAAGDP